MWVHDKEVMEVTLKPDSQMVTHLWSIISPRNSICKCHQTLSHFVCESGYVRIITPCLSLVVYFFFCLPQLKRVMLSFCNLIGGALAEPLEVNGLNPPMLPGSFLLHAERGNKPGDEANCR